MADEANVELETFRKQWQDEVSARAKASSSSKKPAPLSQPRKKGSEKEDFHPPRFDTSNQSWKKAEERVDGLESASYHDLEDKDLKTRLGESSEGTQFKKDAAGEPSSALEHYEQAVERESQGNLGDSLKLYRKAYRLDAGVDRLYKTKHFPPSNSKSKPIDPNPSNASITVPNTAHHSLDGPLSSNIPGLITLFSSLSIPPAPPPADELPPPPCPISILPPEILIHILDHCAVADVALFARLSLVCKRLAYLVATEDQLWKWICLGSDYGFGVMHYSWACTVSGEPLSPEGNLSFDLQSTLDPVHTKAMSLSSPSDSPRISPFPTPILKFSLSPIYPNYRTMFRTRPRVRFNGCYISTVNYIRPGASSPTQISWNVPVHIVTYYRYLRFFRDGSCVSLLTTTEPPDVVPYIRKENIHSHHSTGTLPVAVMKKALRGRWKLTGPDHLTTPDAPLKNTEPEGAIHIETEGVDADKYVYKMHLGFRSAGGGRTGGPRSNNNNNNNNNNRLIWKGFWSYNRLTDDWAEFGLRNDRAFFWSRVRSYGTGE